jgi:uncharacterized protein
MSLKSPAYVRLTPAERSELLRLALESIRAALDGEEPPVCGRNTPALNEPAGVFVSLHLNGHLRGCIGTVTPDRPLHQAVSRMAVSAACGDPRFPPLQKIELPQTSIEISRLSPLFAAHPDQICLGTHGVCLVQGHHHSVFLPQVATLYHWDRDTLLSELCLKAMLPAEAWKHPDTTLMLFEAEVFSD